MTWLLPASVASAQPQLPPEVMRHTIAIECTMRPHQLIDLKAEYRDIIERWARRDPAAVAALDNLGRRVVDSVAGFEVTDRALTERLHSWRSRALVPGISCLGNIEGGLLRQLVDEDWESRAPLWALYLTLHRVQVRAPIQTRRWLTQRTRDRLDWLVDLTRQRGRQRDTDRSIDALMVLALADELQASPYYPLISESQTRFAEAAELDPDSYAAPYWAGAMAERLGDYEEATIHFSELNSRHPDDVEVGLRLALCRARTGKMKAARRELALITQTSSTDWLTILAYEELARIQERRSPSAARQTLLDALELFPDAPQVRLQLISNLVLDNAWKAIDDLVPPLDQVRTEEAPPSPRVLYDEPRRDELDAELNRFALRIQELLPTLERALASVPKF